MWHKSNEASIKLNINFFSFCGQLWMGKNDCLWYVWTLNIIYQFRCMNEWALIFIISVWIHFSLFFCWLLCECHEIEFYYDKIWMLDELIFNKLSIIIRMLHQLETHNKTYWNNWTKCASPSAKPIRTTSWKLNFHKSGDSVGGESFTLDSIKS